MSAPISAALVIAIRERCANGERPTALAKSLNLDLGVVKRVARGKSYPDIGGPITPHDREPRVGIKDIDGVHVWEGIVQRCTNPRAANYRHYGGRGITMCLRWRNSFLSFMADMGPRPSPKHTIDRINNDGNYEPENCRWATVSEQRRNTRRNRLLTIGGDVRPLVDWAASSGVAPTLIRRRLQLGWSHEEAVRTPVGAPRALGCSK